MKDISQSVLSVIADNGILIWTLFIALLFLFIGWSMGLRARTRAPEIVQVHGIPTKPAKVEDEPEYEDIFHEAVHGPPDDREPTM